MKKIVIFFFVLPILLFTEELRIISLGPYVTENLCLLGLEKQIVGLTAHDREEIKKGKTIIGTLLEPNIEKIISLKPDIVIGSKEGNRPEHIRKLNNLGIKTLTLEELYTFKDICRNFITLGETLNCKDKAAEVIKEVKTRLKQTEKQTKQKRKKKVFFILGFKPLFTTGGNTYINQAIEYAGGRNIFRDVKKKWFSCSIEEVIRRNPDVIIFITMEEVEDYLWEKLKNTGAVKNRQIYSVEPIVIGSPTPLSFVETVEEMYKKMYPEKAN